MKIYFVLLVVCTAAIDVLQMAKAILEPARLQNNYKASVLLMVTMAIIIMKKNAREKKKVLINKAAIKMLHCLL